jgi:2-dehydro-3-deoxyphosphogluconate aldolase/(4S)-4-hydroxy-2-oxoglutarate aldolase
LIVKQDTREWICRSGLVPVLRAQNNEEALSLVRAMHAGGVNIIEVTTTVPHAADVLLQLKREFGDTLLLGAGTVTTVEECLELIAAGAEFVVSPTVQPDVITATKQHGKLMIAGALTPTEIVTSWRAGADIIKVFPCSAMGGASYLKSIRGPFPNIPLIPTGGVSLATAKDFLAAGAIALGVGTDLVNLDAIRSGKPEVITETARFYLAIIAEWQQQIA